MNGSSFQTGRTGIAGCKSGCLPCSLLQGNSTGPRLSSFSGILKARKKVIEEWDLDALGIPEEAVGAKGSPTIVSEMATVEKRRNVEILRGNAEEKADSLISRLDEAGII